MSIHCDVTLRWGATPGQLRALGAALWRWSIRGSAGTGMYQHLDDQVLADLIDGQFPAIMQTPPQAESAIQFSIRDEVSQDPEATLASLRRAIPAEGVEDIVVGGISWHLITRGRATGPVRPPS